MIMILPLKNLYFVSVRLLCLLEISKICVFLTPHPPPRPPPLLQTIQRDNCSQREERDREETQHGF